MSKKSTFTNISPLPAGISREVVIDFLHNHQEMIDLNPLVIERHPISPPGHAAEDEKSCVWWSMTDKISYLPGGLMTGDVTYTCAFHDLPDGLQTHCYAPASTDIRDRWTLGGTLPGEAPQPVELGLGAPQQGLYIREDVELRCNFLMSGFVKKTLQGAHKTLVDALGEKARRVALEEAEAKAAALSSTSSSTSSALHPASSAGEQHQRQMENLGGPVFLPPIDQLGQTPRVTLANQYSYQPYTGPGGARAAELE